MFLCLFTLLILPPACALALCYVNGSTPAFLDPVVARAVSVTTWAVLRAVNRVETMRSDYIWERRASPFLPALARSVFDRLLAVDSSLATLGVSTGHESVRVDEAIATYDGTDYGVRDMLEVMWHVGDGETLRFNLQRVLGLSGVLVDGGSELTLRVRYSGHGNAKKRVLPRTFTVRYAGSVDDVASFPPYPASCSVNRGLGSVRIISAEHGEGCSRVSCTGEARESAGLRGKFYDDLSPDDGPLVRNSVTFLSEPDRIHEDLRLKVFTSRGVLEFN